jgi:hypothetical protein
MRESVRPLGSLLWLSALVVCACAKPAPVPAAVPRVVAPAPAPRATLYAADEALHDALSGPLEYLGTGKWTGAQRMYACAFRNQRVLVVSAYCSLKEVNAFRVDVYSPARGRVRIYAEANGPISERTRQDYFTFTAETEPPANPEAGLPPPSLGMSFEQLQAYDERRYAAFLPACYGGTEHQLHREGCLEWLAPRIAEWKHRNQHFLEDANHDWYQLVREMRALALQHGREPD